MHEKGSSVGWLVVLGLTAYETVFQSISCRLPERGRKKWEINDRQEKNCPNNPHPHLLQAKQAHALLLFKLAGRPGTGSLPSTIVLPDHPWEVQICLVV